VAAVLVQAKPLVAPQPKIKVSEAASVSMAVQTTLRAAAAELVL
jgi:hypothetical protein